MTIAIDIDLLGSPIQFRAKRRANGSAMTFSIVSDGQYVWLTMNIENAEALAAALQSGIEELRAAQ